MNVQGKHYRTIWVKEDDDKVVQIIDQRPLPHKFVIENITNSDEMAIAIKDMHLRGAGLIGAAAGYGMYLAALEASELCSDGAQKQVSDTPKDENFDDYMIKAGEKLKATRPTAVNLKWAVHRQLDEMKKSNSINEKVNITFKTANIIADEDSEFCKRLGEHGVKIIEEINKKKNGEVVNILTHCNAGWLAFVDYGSATAPIYEAFNKGIKLHVWVDETRPRNQGARLTAWELGEHGVPHTVIPDNVGGHLMQHGMVDMCITGTDRTTYTGDVANKIGTYLKALAANDNNVPFYVALPSSTFDWTIKDGVKEIPIEQRGENEVKHIQGMHDGELKKVLLCPANSPATNFAFDVTPARLITGLITERGICKANEEDILRLYPEKKTSEPNYVGIKYECEKVKGEIEKNSKTAELLAWCRKFHEMDIAPAYEGGSFGNLSFRNDDHMIITASSTGLGTTKEEEFVKVYGSEQGKILFSSIEEKKPSSEAPLHSEIYKKRSDVNAIFHGHDELVLKHAKRLGLVETEKEHPYGTPEFFNEVLKVLGNNNFIVWKNHGICAMGNTMEEAGKLAVEMHEKAVELDKV